MDVMLKTVVDKHIDSFLKWMTLQSRVGRSRVDRDLVRKKMVELGFYDAAKSAAPKKKSTVVHRTNERLVVRVKRNEHGNFTLSVPSCDPCYDDLNTSRLVFDLTTKIVTGYQNSSTQTVEPLTKYLIEICNKYKLRFKIPLLLNTAVEQSSDEGPASQTSILGLRFRDSDQESDDEDGRKSQ